MGKYYILFFIIFLSYSCITERGCERGKRNYGKQDVYILLAAKPQKKFEYYELVGKDLHSGRDTTTRLYGRWYETLGKIWNSGDTLIKKKDELFVTVRKKDNSVYVSEWTCEDVYLNGRSVRTGMRRPE